jgi:hypothetical protein
MERPEDVDGTWGKINSMDPERWVNLQERSHGIPNSTADFQEMNRWCVGCKEGWGSQLREN